MGQQTFTDLLTQVVFLCRREDLLIFQLVQLENIADQVGQTAGCVRDGLGVLQPLFLAESGLLEHGSVIAHDGQRGFQLMRYVGNKVGTQSLNAGQLLRHFVQTITDLLKLNLRTQTGHGRDANRKITLHHLLRRFGDPLDRTVYHQLSAHAVDHGAKKAQQKHIGKGQLCCSTKIFCRQFQSHHSLQRGNKQHHAAGDDKSHEQKEHYIVIERQQYLLIRFLPFHFNTAL